MNDSTFTTGEAIDYLLNASVGQQAQMIGTDVLIERAHEGVVYALSRKLVIMDVYTMHRKWKIVEGIQVFPTSNGGNDNEGEMVFASVPNFPSHPVMPKRDLVFA